MSLACKISATILVVLFSAGISSAGESDSWFTRDKAEHFAVSAFYSAAAAQVAHRHFDMGKNNAMAVGIGFTISLGAAKEAYDLHSPKETASIKDLAWDLAGTLIGALVFSIAQ